MTEREQFLSDIITNSIEAGYPWFYVDQYQYVMDKKVHVYCGTRQGDQTQAILREENDDEDGYKDEQLLLDLAAVARGIHRILSGEVEVGILFHKRLKEATKDNDSTNIDAPDADAIVQAALLGDIVYS